MYKISVPLEKQQKRDTCWHASALMIWRYFQIKNGRKGPIHTLGDNWNNNRAILPNEFIRLATNVGLVEVPHANNRNHTAESLEDLLRTHGPIWCAGFWYGVAHIVVLTGVDDNMVMLNDPDGGKARMGQLSWFNRQLASHYRGCMMIKDPTQY